MISDFYKIVTNLKKGGGKKELLQLPKCPYVRFRGNSNQDQSLNKSIYISNSSIKIISLPYQNLPIKIKSNWVTLLVIICHYFTKKGGGSIFQLFVTIHFVTIRLRREGVWCNLALVTNFPVFFYWRLPLVLLQIMSFVLFIQTKKSECGISQPRYCIAGDNGLKKRGDRTTA